MANTGTIYIAVIKDLNIVYEVNFGWAKAKFWRDFQPILE